MKKLSKRRLILECYLERGQSLNKIIIKIIKKATGKAMKRKNCSQISHISTTHQIHLAKKFTSSTQTV